MTAATRTPGQRGAIYLRVSTREQTMENQERELRQWADRLGLEWQRKFGAANTALHAWAGGSRKETRADGGHVQPHGGSDSLRVEARSVPVNAPYRKHTFGVGGTNAYQAATRLWW